MRRPSPPSNPRAPTVPRNTHAPFPFDRDHRVLVNRVPLRNTEPHLLHIHDPPAVIFSNEAAPPPCNTRHLFAERAANGRTTLAETESSQKQASKKQKLYVKHNQSCHTPTQRTQLTDSASLNKSTDHDRETSATPHHLHAPVLCRLGHSHSRCAFNSIRNPETLGGGN